MEGLRRMRRHAALAVTLSASLAAVGGAGGSRPEVYLRTRAEFNTARGRVKGFEVKARMFYPFSVREVLDASHDHVHLAEQDPDIKREDVIRADCTKELCRINVHVLVGSFFPVGKITYELRTDVTHERDGSVVVRWEKESGTRLIKHLHGRLTLIPSDDGASTSVDYHLQVAAPRLSVDRLADKAVAYLERLDAILHERHEDHVSLWSTMHEE